MYNEWNLFIEIIKQIIFFIQIESKMLYDKERVVGYSKSFSGIIIQQT